MQPLGAYIERCERDNPNLGALLDAWQRDFRRKSRLTDVPKINREPFFPPDKVVWEKECPTSITRLIESEKVQEIKVQEIQIDQFQGQATATAESIMQELLAQGLSLDQIVMPGGGKEVITYIADDFDAPIEDFEDYL